jgi:rhomboid family GlyGly-CTERM serine protease
MIGTTMIRNKRTDAIMCAFKRPSADSIVLAAVIALLNLHLIGMIDQGQFLFYPQRFASGEWWRVFTHAFVHVSPYHLVFDAGSFFILYTSLYSLKVIERLFHVMVSGILSLAAVCFFSPEVNSIGFCGLSGIDHGLFVIMALFMIQEKRGGAYRFVCLALVTAKCVFELIAGGSYFSFLHFGQCGTPLVSSHIGGALGGALSFFLVNTFRLKTSLKPLLQGDLS